MTNMKPLGQVDSCEIKSNVGSVSAANLFYFVKNDTKIYISGTSKSSASSITSAVKADLPVGLEALSSAVASTFAGYRSEVSDSLGVTCLGLGCAHRLNINAPTSTAAVTGSRTAAELMKAPKGLILHGPAGTGKSSLMRGLVAALGCNSVELSHNVLLSRYVLYMRKFRE